MKTLILIASLFSSLCFAFEGQPKTLTMMASPGATLTVEVPDITGDMLTFEKPCEAGRCLRALDFIEDFEVTVGDAEYVSSGYLAVIDTEGEVIFEEDKAAKLYLTEKLTGNILSINFRGPRTFTCFGSTKRGFCTRYATLETY